MRLEGRIKMGFYPTPISVIERINKFLEFSKEELSILDPCCGDGLALKNISESKNAKTYGVELDEARAEESKKNLDYVLNAGIENVRISNDCFSCLFLNPPYDLESLEDGSERKEKLFLKETQKYLQPDGILIYIISQERLNKEIAKILSYRFENIRVYSFQQEEYELYRQIVVFGVKKNKSSLDNEAQAYLESVPRIKLEEIPLLNEPFYKLPVSRAISIFRSNLINKEELTNELKKSPLWNRIHELSRPERNSIERPPLPLHTGHIGLLLANGCLDGVIGEGSDRHIVKGKVEKLTTKFVEEKENGVVEERELERFRVSIKILKQNGEIFNLV